MKKYSEIIEKYNINNIPEIKFQIDSEEYKKLSESKKILYNYLENE